MRAVATRGSDPEFYDDASFPGNTGRGITTSSQAKLYRLTQNTIKQVLIVEFIFCSHDSLNL